MRYSEELLSIKNSHKKFMLQQKLVSQNNSQKPVSNRATKLTLSELLQKRANRAKVSFRSQPVVQPGPYIDSTPPLKCQDGDSIDEQVESLDKTEVMAFSLDYSPGQDTTKESELR